MVKAREVDVTWEHCTTAVPNNKTRLRCNYCGKEYSGGVFRMKHHLGRTKQNVAACTQNPDDVVDKFKLLLKENEEEKEKRDDAKYDVGRPDFYYQDREEIENARVARGKRKMDDFVVRGDKKTGKQATINQIWKKGDRDKVCQNIARFFYSNALSFNLVKCPFFDAMVESITYFGHGLKVPSYHEMRNTFLKREVENIESMMDEYKKEWKKTGCTLMSDGWTDGVNRSITNFLVNSPKGTVFLRSVDTSDISKNADNLFALLDSVVEEVGEENVVQVITDSAAAYVRAGELLMEKRKKLFWSPCAAHCIDLMLEDVGKLPTHAETIAKARMITVYIYNHSWVLHLMRKHTKGELTRPAVTRFATCFLTLKSLRERKAGLMQMFASDDWQKSPYSKKADGSRICGIVLGDSTFWPSVYYCLKCTSPLVKVLRLVDSDERPAMGYIYEAMDRAKEAIAKNLGNIKKKYEQIWNIIDERWDRQLHRPLHAAGYFLNPRFQYETSNDVDIEIKVGLLDCLERMVPSSKERVLIGNQIDKFKKAEGLFGREMAKLMRKEQLPGLWWDAFGDECPELQKFAIRIESLTCSASGCERNWSTFEQVNVSKSTFFIHIFLFVSL
ncbi:uncharacterized protein LOC143885307 [Tasmannia lanceolata]|uniref:uncharacterized protein LOC143885307 n=1 Tax=Tasmannia lanceolata TaxID=3420 RepID=UPI004064619D